MKIITDLKMIVVKLGMSERMGLIVLSFKRE